MHALDGAITTPTVRRGGKPRGEVAHPQPGRTASGRGHPDGDRPTGKIDQDLQTGLLQGTYAQHRQLLSGLGRTPTL